MVSKKPVSVRDLPLPLGTSNWLLCKRERGRPEGRIFMLNVSMLKYLVPNHKNDIDQKEPLEMYLSLQNPCLECTKS